MLADFSAGYYVGQVYLESHEGDIARLARDLHETANEEIYATDVGIERLDLPLVVKLAETHLPTVGEDDLPTDTLAVPDFVFDNTAFDRSTQTEVLIAKAERAANLLEWFTPYTINEPSLT